MQNWTPGDYFHHPDYGYQQVSHIRGDCIFFLGQRSKRFIGEGGNVERRKFGPIDYVPVLASEATPATEEEVMLVAALDARFNERRKTAEPEKPTQPEITAEPMPADVARRIKETIAQTKAKLEAQKAQSETKKAPETKRANKLSPYNDYISSVGTSANTLTTSSDRGKGKVESLPPITKEAIADVGAGINTSLAIIDAGKKEVNPPPAPSKTKRANKLSPYNDYISRVGTSANTLTTSSDRGKGKVESLPPITKEEIADVGAGINTSLTVIDAGKEKVIPLSVRLRMYKEAERFDQLRHTLNWLQDNGLPPIPVAPVYDPDRYGKGQGFNTKNPSWLDVKGEPHQIRWKRFLQGAMPSNGELAQWFSNLDNGIGTFSGINNIYWIDLDRKHFDSDAECENAAMKLWEKVGEFGLLEKTQSGGWRIAFRHEGDRFKTFSFSMEEGGPLVGEILGYGHFVVLGPSYGVMGNYETVKRSRYIPTVNLEELGIYKRAYKRIYNPEVYENLDFVRFPASLYSYYGHPMKLWVLARAKDGKGAGRAVLRMAEVRGLVKRSTSTIRRWMAEGIKKGLFSARTFNQDGECFIEIYYASKEKACFGAGRLDLGTVGLINIKEDLEALHVVATDIIALGIQRRSRHAQYQEQVKKASQRLGVAEEFAEKKAVKPLPPERLGHPCENKMARVLWSDDRFVFGSEGLAAYGASLETIAGERGLSVRQSNRHLVSSYREAPSPVWGFRDGVVPIQKRQIVQRLPRSEMNDYVYSAVEYFDGEGLDDAKERGRYYKDLSGRYWERKCCVIVPHFRLVRCRFRRWRLAKGVRRGDRPAAA